MSRRFRTGTERTSNGGGSRRRTCEPARELPIPEDGGEETRGRNGGGISPRVGGATSEEVKASPMGSMPSMGEERETVVEEPSTSVNQQAGEQEVEHEGSTGDSPRELTSRSGMLGCW